MTATSTTEAIALFASETSAIWENQSQMRNFMLSDAKDCTSGWARCA